MDNPRLSGPRGFRGFSFLVLKHPVKIGEAVLD
jgi:hypothetical protein